MTTDATSARPAGPLEVGVTFRPIGKIYHFDPGNLILDREDRVIVETERGAALGTIVFPPRVRNADAGSLRRVVKKADARDLAREDLNHQRERDAYRFCLERIRERRMPMKLVKADLTFDGSKTIVYFTAEGRVDFRDLVRDLAQHLHTRVEMKQIGARDETKVTGGLGPCGRELCCSSWLREFAVVSVKMAKEQDLSLNPSRLAGVCGRLKCCLRYEYETYVELKKGLPGIGKQVESVKGSGQVARQNILKQTVVIRRADDGVEVEATLEDLVEKKAGD
jgi:cell fate regulator YaaT (PSP1 superfamily)